VIWFSSSLTVWHIGELLLILLDLDANLEALVRELHELLESLLLSYQELVLRLLLLFRVLNVVILSLEDSI
jgi:hypothetical protein